VNPKPDETGSLRAFVAAELPEDLLKAVDAVQADLRRRGVRVRWTRPENVHLTLKFLGDLPAVRVADVTDAMRSAAAGHDAFRLAAAGIGVFPGLRRPRVLWAGLSGAVAALERLQQALDDRLAAAGIPREARGFHGHLTLGRFGEGAAAGPVADALSVYAAQGFGSFEVRELVLFQSDLRPRGPVYTALARAPLRGTS
jgi:RNA 2',3'-cyclic 3'-phosphodiesterase